MKFATDDVACPSPAVASSARDPRVNAVERLLGRLLPEDYRELMTVADGTVETYPDAYLDLWSLESVLSAMTDPAFDYSREAYPGLLIIGTDGASEMLGFDFRRTPPPVVLVNSVSAGWHEACYQADTITGLLADLRAGGSFKFDGGYD